MRVAIAGTRPVTLAALPGNVSVYEPSGAWLGKDRVIVTTSDPALYEVPARGGKVKTVLAGGESDKVFTDATMLPGDRGVLFVVTSSKPPRALELWTPDGKRKVIRELPDIRLLSLAVSRTGHVLFDRWDGTRGLWALPFSLEKLEVTREPRPVSNVGYRPSVSEDGTLVCAMGGMQDEAFARLRLVWVDRTGAVGEKIGPALPGFTAVRLSPDGRRAVAMAGEGVDGLDIWLFDVATGQADRLTQNRVQDSLPHWWDGGRTIIFGQSRTNGDLIVRRPAQAFGEEQLLTAELEWCWTASASTGTLLGRARGPAWGYVSFSGERPLFVPLPEPLQGIGDPEFSPDGKRLAYRTAEIGPGEICVLDFPALTNLRQISRRGGWCPQWHPAASELFFVSQDGRSLMTARQRSDGSGFDAPAKVFDLPDGISPGHPGWPTFYSVSPDGQRFLMLQKEEEASTGAARGKPNALVIMNWFEELREKK